MTGNLAVLTNIPTPYRKAFFDVLGEYLHSGGGRLNVFYCAKTEAGRHWMFDESTLEGALLPGISPRVGGVSHHINPTAVGRIRAVAPDWLLIAGGWNTPTMMAVATAERGRVPRIFWSEGHSDAVRHPSGVIAKARQRIMSTFDGFAVPNERSEEFARQQSNDRSKPILRLPNSVDESVFDPKKARPWPEFEALEISPDSRLVALVASLEPRKRVLESLAAFRRLPEKQRQSMHLVLVGAGPLFAAVQREASGDPNIHVVGQRQQEEVRDILVGADAFLLGSSYDPNPLSVIEAALCGCYLITSRSVGNSDELVRATGGYVFEDGPGHDVVQGIHGALLRLADMPRPRLNELRDHVRDFALSRYSRARVAASLVEQLEQSWPASSSSN